MQISSGWAAHTSSNSTCMILAAQCQFSDMQISPAPQGSSATKFTNHEQLHVCAFLNRPVVSIRTSKGSKLGRAGRPDTCTSLSCFHTFSLCQHSAFLLLYCDWSRSCCLSATAASRSQWWPSTIIFNSHWRCPLPWRCQPVSLCACHYCRFVLHPLCLSQTLFSAGQPLSALTSLRSAHVTRCLLAVTSFMHRMISVAWLCYVGIINQCNV